MLKKIFAISLLTLSLIFNPKVSKAEEFGNVNVKGTLDVADDITLNADIIFQDDDVPTDRYLKIDDQATSDTEGNSLYIQAGKGNGTEEGGTTRLQGGEGGETGVGGGARLYGGSGGNTSGNGGEAKISGGMATVGDGGDVVLQGGWSADGARGEIKLYNLTNAIYTILDISEVTGTDKTFTFPNVTGTFLLKEQIDTSAELYGILTDETGSDSGTPLLVFNQNPTIAALTGTGVFDLGEVTLEIPNAANPTLGTTGQIAINTTDKTLELNNGANQVAFPTIHMAQGIFDLAAQYETDSDLWLVDLNTDSYPHGIYITKIYVDCTVADPTTELDANLMYCDAVANGAFPGANATLIKAIDTTTGNFADAAVNIAVPTGKALYINMDADPMDINTEYHIRIHYYIPTA